MRCAFRIVNTIRPIMKQILSRFLVLAALLASATGLRAQVLPLAAGNEWFYASSDRSDTTRVSIEGKQRLVVECRRGASPIQATVTSDGYAYLNLAGGFVVARRGVNEAGDSIVSPLFFLPGALKKGTVPTPLRQDCAGTYSFIGFAAVTTPAGTFDACLIFDDRSVHRLYVAPGIGIVKEERYRAATEEGTAAERAILWSRILVAYTPPLHR
jgi:hypothetical protein